MKNAFIFFLFVWLCNFHTASAVEPDLLTSFRKDVMRDVSQIVFAVRADDIDGHWYANFSYYADDENRIPDPYKGGKLCVYDLNEKKLTTLLDDPAGSIRDPQVNYEATKILFSYRKGDSKFYHLYEINTDGSGLHPLTDGDFDDIEPTYIADGSIVFVSSRAKRWVNCWLVQVAILYGCDANGSNIHPLSGNIEQDNTPSPLPDGRILYTRWEYVDRSQVHYHHLWTMNPDGTKQMVYFGNYHPGMLYIDARPIPESNKIVCSFSPGHGITQHSGYIGIIDPNNGPDDKASAQRITNKEHYRDPWAFSENAFLAASKASMVVLDDKGNEQIIFELPKEWTDAKMCLQEPRPIIQRPREAVISSTVKPDEETGKLMLVDVYQGRNMTDVKRGDIKKLLILETLPKPINFTGGMEPLSYGGTFTLERIFGTVPVDPDGSAYFELPALRSFFFIALDKDDRAVKRMQSFHSVMPGEITSCIGCHENRNSSPRPTPENKTAFKRPPVQATPIADIPDVIDFTRDIQPILDARCVQCHSPQKRNGGVSLVGHHTPLYTISYYTITAKSLVADGRNLPKSNYPPYALGSGSSRLLEFCNGEHHGAKLTDKEKLLMRYWVEIGAPYPGTYAALGSGMIGGYAQNTLDRSDRKWKEVEAMTKVLQQNCTSCHTKEKNNQLPLSPSDEIANPPWETLSPNDVRRKYSRQLLYDLTQPEQSVLLLAPLAKSEGGYESCGSAILKNKKDPRYKTILAGIERTKKQLDSIKRFDMPGFVPRPQYIRELKKYGIIPADQDETQVIDTYEADQKYWKSLWYVPEKDGFLSSAAKYTMPSPSWAKDLIIYELNPKGFNSPKGPETGTFNSVREKIPYLKDLGINGVWFTGHSWGDHLHFYNIWTQYACIRHDSIEPSLGTPEEFKAMIDDFHSHGIRVFLDVITHGVINYSPLISEHPTWFKGGSWGMTDFDWFGGHTDLDEWWVKTHTDCVTQYGVDGYRLDVDMIRPDLWNKIKENAAQAGHPIVIIDERTQYCEGVTDFYQRVTPLSVQTKGINTKCRLTDNVAAFYSSIVNNEFTTYRKNEKKPDNYLQSIQLSCHDDGWDGFPLTDNPYVAEGSRCLFGYSCLFQPAIPLFMSGEEFDADYVPFPSHSPFLFKKEKAGEGKWLYATWIQWDQLKEKKHADMLTDVKKMIAIRKQESKLIHALQNNVLPNLDSLAFSCSEKVPVPYIIWNDKTALIVAGNPTDKDVQITVNIPLDKIKQNTKKIIVTDLWNGSKKKWTPDKLKKFSFTVKKDYTSGGGISIFKIE